MGNGNGDSDLKRRLSLFEKKSSPPPEVEKSTFMAFGKAIQAGDRSTAGRHLGTLMDLSEKDGLAAAKFFQERTQKDPETIPKTMQIRGAISEGKTNEAMARLIECFGLDGLRAITAVGAMRWMLES